MLVLIAIEPRSYKEAIGAVVRDLRPRLEVRMIEPEELEAEVARSEPDAVIGNLPEPAAAGARFAWVVFRPYEEPAARIRVGRRRWELRDVSLEDLLFVVDEAAHLARQDET